MDSRAEAGFADFMRGRWSALVRLGYGLTGDARLAESLARSAFAKAYASWPRVLRSGDPNVYICGVMLNASLDRFRRRKADQPGPDMPRGQGAAPQARNGDGRPALVTALMRLPARQRSVVLLRYWMDMTEAEVANALGCSVGSVRNQAALALAALRAGEGVAEETVLWASRTSWICDSSSAPSSMRSRRRSRRSGGPSGKARSFRRGGASGSSRVSPSWQASAWERRVCCVRRSASQRHRPGRRCRLSGSARRRGPAPASERARQRWWRRAPGSYPRPN